MGMWGGRNGIQPYSQHGGPSCIKIIWNTLFRKMQLTKCFHYRFLILKTLYIMRCYAPFYRWHNWGQSSSMSRSYSEEVTESAFSALLTLCMPVAPPKQKIHWGFPHRSPPQEGQCDARDWKPRDTTWIHQLVQWHFEFLDFRVSPIFNELLRPEYLMPKSCHEAQTRESQTLSHFRWPVSPLDST